MINPLVSIIITTKNSENTLKACLESIKNQTYENIELIVVDNNSIDRTKEIASNYTDKVYNVGPERCTQRNYGAKISKGEYVLILDSDMELSNKVVKSCIENIFLNASCKAIIIPEESYGKGFWAKCKRLERSFYVGVDWIEAARFFNKSIFNELGGYDIKLIGGDDYDLSQKFIRAYGENSIERISDYIYHNEQNLSLKGTLKKKFYYSQTIIIYKEKSHNRNFYKKQSSLLMRYKLFFSQPKKLLKYPFLSLGMIFMKTSEFIFGGLGYLNNNIRNYKKHS